MNDERYKELMNQVGMSNSRSILQAFKQIANEVAQEVHAEYGKEIHADSTQQLWKIPESRAIICPGCGWIGTKHELNDHACPICDYAYGEYVDLPTLEILFSSDELWNDVAIGPFALSVCRVLRINNLLDLATNVKDSVIKDNVTLHDLKVLHSQACKILRKIKGEK